MNSDADTGAVRLRALARRFREGTTRRDVLAGVDADIAAGEVALIMGRSGSGKSTLLNLIGGIDLPDAGDITVGDIEVSALNERERTLFRRRHIGFVFQFFQLIPTLSVIDNVLLPLDLNGIHGNAARERALLILERVGLADRAPSAPDRLSGGEQQRVAVARAIVHQPRLLLADEPTGNLDATAGQTIVELLAALARDNGTTVIMATHSRDARSLADRCLYLNDGLLSDAREQVAIS